ncbi:hypothetical protein K402DRAFT_455016 [Aulographum hederae CBS 113979]|uniref:Uncharacterized protein n=1 Tax=Aulographum hederae CBS 113979 TaxID=1176131 RepID=A0A6G1GX53_9PEZI|nr:hypothetical protein K402DRAFT_455016 [Aulographum hederae CBS 113979]
MHFHSFAIAPLLLGLASVALATQDPANKTVTDYAVDLHSYLQRRGLNYTTDEVDEISKRDVMLNVWMCNGYKWRPPCANTMMKLGICHSLLMSPFWHKISSIGPDHHTYCWAHSDNKCMSDDELILVKPGYEHLESDWNDRIGSIMCISNFDG